MLCKGNLILATAAGCDDAVADAKPTLQIQTEDDRFSEKSRELNLLQQTLSEIDKSNLKCIFHEKLSTIEGTLSEDNFFLMSTVTSRISQVHRYGS